MEIEKRKGDRSVKQNDKHLFMETLLSARDKFYLSYLGQSTADNTMLPPSSVVEELLQYISDKAVNPNAVEEVLVTRQPLHSYSKRYNREVALPNYLLQSGAVSSEILLTEPRKVEVVRAIPYQNFILAITEPIKYFYTKILQVRGEEDDEEIEDTELFELDGLQNWALKKEVSTHAGEAREKIEEGLKKKGMLPLLNAGKLVLEGVEEKLGGLPLQMLELTDGIPSAAIDFSLDVDGQLIDGKINNIYDKKYVAVCFSGQKSELKHLIKSFIDYSILCAAGLDYDYYFSSTESQQIFTGSKIEKDKALEILRELLPLYFLAGRKPIGFALDFLKEVTEVPDLNNVDKWIQQDYNNIKRYAKPFIDNQFEEGLFTEPEYFTDFELFYNATIPAVMEFLPSYFG